MKSLLPLLFLFAATTSADGETTRYVSNASDLRAALAQAAPGTRIRIAPGEYPAGFYLTHLQGSESRPIIIEAQDPEHPPLFVGGGNGMHIVRPAHVELRHLHFSGAKSNGLSIDDGSVFTGQAHHVLLKGLRVRDVGPRGNHDGIKLSGLHGFRVEGCTVENWGIGSGGGIDMVGCHDGVIVGNTFRHSARAEDTGGTGIQAKGGSSRIRILGNRFEHAGQRAINIGGSTGMAYFRPPLDRWPEGRDRFEAAEIHVEGNTFIGSLAPVAFVGVDRATVRRNTFFLPARWILRILQETREPGFAPSRRGDFSENIVVFDSVQWNSGGVNIGPETAPETFTFSRNVWFCRDVPEQSRPELPTTETDGVYGQDPKLRDPAGLDLRLAPDAPFPDRGAAESPAPQ
jgi:hypothetical protein